LGQRIQISGTRPTILGTWHCTGPRRTKGVALLIQQSAPPWGVDVVEEGLVGGVVHEGRHNVEASGQDQEVRGAWSQAAVQRSVVSGRQAALLRLVVWWWQVAVQRLV
jgi:hypothetical protein